MEWQLPSGEGTGNGQQAIVRVIPVRNKVSCLFRSLSQPVYMSPPPPIGGMRILEALDPIMWRVCYQLSVPCCLY